MLGGDLKQQSTREVDGSQRAPARSAAGPDARRRLIEGFTRTVAEQSYASTEVDDVIGRAGVSRAAFDTHFESLEQCLLAAHDAFFERLWEVTVEACEAEAGDWPVRVRAGLSAALEFVVDAPGVARVFIVEIAEAGPAGIERQQAAIGRFATMLRQGRSSLPGADSLPGLTEQFLVAGVVSVVEERLLLEEAELIPELKQELSELLVAPYRAQVVASRPAHP